MSIKVGEAYWEVTTRYNKAADTATAAQIRKNLQAQANDQDQILGPAEKKLFDQKIKNLEYIKGLNKKADQEDQARFQTSVANINRSISAQKSLQAQKDRSILADRKAQDIFERNRSRNNQSETRDLSLLGRLKSKLANDEQKNNEGTFHKLATQFRTIGTLARGIGIGVGVLSGFSLIRDAIGGIISAGPIAAAAIALIPPAIAAVGVEALILKGAFKGVGSAIQDAFDPTKSKQFAQDLKGLAPSARSFVLEIQKAKGVLPNIQQTFFSAPQMQQAGKNVKNFFEGIKGNFKALVSANGGLAGGIATAITGSKGTKSIDSFLGSLSTLITDITPAASKLTGSLLDFISRVANQMAGPGGKKISHFFDQVSAFLDKVNVPGLLDKASAAFHAFGGVISNIGGAINGIIKALGGSQDLGASFFKNVGGLFKEIDTFANSATGQQFLTQLFSTLNVLSGLSNSVLKDGLSFLSGVFAGLYPAIKPFVDQITILVDNIFTPQFGLLIGQVASQFLSVGTQLLKTLNPAITGLINFLEKHPTALTVLATGIGAVWLALKVSKGVSAVATGINSIATALNFFKNPKSIIKGMGEVAAGETAVGDAAATAGGKSKVGALTGALGKAGLVGALAYAFGALEDPKGFNHFNDNLANMGKKIEGLISGKKGSVGTFWKALNGADVNGNGGFGIKDFKKSPFMKNFALPIGDFFSNTLPHYFDVARHNTASFADSFISSFTKIPGQLKRVFSPIGTFFTKTIPGWASTMAHNVSAHFDEVRANVHSWWSDVANFFTGTVQNFITKTVPGWFTGMAHGIDNVFNGIRSRVSQFVKDDIEGTINKVSNFITKTVPGWFDSMASKANNTLNGARSRISQFIDNDVKGAFNRVNSFITKTIPSWWNTQATHVNNTLNGARNRIKQFIANDIKAVFNTVQSFLTKTVPSWFDSMKKTVLNDISSLVNGIQNVWSKIVNVFANPVNTVVNKVITGLVQAWNDVDSKLGNKFNMSKPKFVAPGPSNKVKVPSNAAGGFISKSYGGPTQDNVYLRPMGNTTHPGINVSGGEYVVKASSTEKLNRSHPGLLDGLNSFADGGLVPSYRGGGASWPTIVQFERMFNIPFRVTSTTGGTHATHSFHYAGEAVDVASSAGNMNNLAANLARYAPFFLEMFHSPSWFVKNGAKHAPIDYATHFNHIHAAMTEAGALAAIAAKKSGKIPATFAGGAGGIILDPAIEAVSTQAKFLKKFNGIVNAVKLPQTGYTPEAAKVGPTTVDHMNAWSAPLIKKAVAAAQAAASASFGAGTALGKVGSGQIAAWIQEASKYANIPASWVLGIETIIRRESGGNPRAINRTDSNARAGHPSQGLMQTIPSTFYANVPAALRSRGILDPVANIAAAVNYIHRRYGDISRVQQANPNRPPRGYATGTSSAEAGWHWVGEKGPELMRFRGGETVLNHQDSHALTGYAKGTKVPTSLMDAVRNISTSFDGSASTIVTAVNSLSNKIINALSKRNQVGLPALVKATGKLSEQLATQLKASKSNTTSLTAAKASTSESITSAIAGLNDITSLPYDVGVPGGATTGLVSGLRANLKSAKAFSASLKKLHQKGLSGQLVAQLAAGGIGQQSLINSINNGATTDIKRLNSLSTQIGNYSTSAASSVSGYVYDKSIKASVAETAKLTKQMKRVADNLEKQVSHDITLVVDGVDVTSKAHIAKHNKDLVLALNRKTGR